MHMVVRHREHHERLVLSIMQVCLTGRLGNREAEHCSAIKRSSFLQADADCRPKYSIQFLMPVPRSARLFFWCY